MSVVAPSEGEPSTGGSGVTADEAALYDRQIRLWGFEAQSKYVYSVGDDRTHRVSALRSASYCVREWAMSVCPFAESVVLLLLCVDLMAVPFLRVFFCSMRTARVLVYGLDGVVAEVVKNIVLAGVGHGMCPRYSLPRSVQRKAHCMSHISRTLSNSRTL
jgi:molybdopterin/thiamine biosynthesis adenylyltransferase